MKKALTKYNEEIYYYLNGEKKIIDSDDKSTYPKNITGNISGLYGDISELTGNISGLTGNISGLTGNISGITGSCTGIVGDLGNCELTREERKKGIDIGGLIK